jgi:hypothetical protein
VGGDGGFGGGGKMGVLGLLDEEDRVFAIGKLCTILWFVFSPSELD